MKRATSGKKKKKVDIVKTFKATIAKDGPSINQSQ